MPTVNSRSANGALNTYAEEARDRRRQRSGRRAAVATEDDLLLALQAGTNARIFEEEGGEEIGEASLLQKQREALATRKTQIKREYFAHRQRVRRQHQLQLGSIDEGPYGGYTDVAFDGAGPPPDTAGSADSADGGAPPPDGAGLSVDDARPDSADEPPPGSG